MNTDYAKKCIATFAELHRAEQYESTQNTDNDYDEPTEQQEEWMLLCQLQPTFSTLELPQGLENVNWSANCHNQYYFHVQTG